MNTAQRVFSGRVRVRVQGTQLERMINVCAKRGISLYRVVRLDQHTLCLDVTYRDFFLMRPILRETHGKVKILSRYGIPHMQGWFRGRSMLAIGAILCFLLLIGGTQFVWGIRVIGVEMIDAESVQEVLQEEKVRPGMLRSELSMPELVDTIQMRIPGLTFVGVRMRGLLLEVEIIHGTEPSKQYDRETPVDIVAAYDAIIERITVLEGRAAVRIGQQVHKGDVLIYGRAVGPMGERDVHALGEVVARVWVEGQGEAPLTKIVKQATGRFVNRRSVVICGRMLPTFAEPYFEHYEIASHEEAIMPGLFLPTSLRRETLHEMEMYRIPRMQGVVEEEAEEKATIALLNSLEDDVTVVDKWVEFSKIKEDILHAKVRLQILKNIGYEKLL